MLERAWLAGVLGCTLLLAGCADTSPPAHTAASSQAPPPAAIPPARASPGPPNCFRQIAIPIRPAASHGMTWKGSLARSEGDDPHALFAVAPISRMCAIRLRFTLVTHDGKPAGFQLFWASVGKDPSEAEGSFTTTLESSAAERTLVVRGCSIASPPCIDRNIDRFRIDPATAPNDFLLTEMTVLAE